MKDKEKTKEQLVEEVTGLRQKISRLEETLEDVVKERTAVFAKANKQFQKEITERKKFEEELKQTEERYHNLVELANAGIITAENNKIIQVNKMAEEIYGYSREELIGQSPSIVVPEKYKKNHKEIFEEMLGSKKLRLLSFEEEGLRKDGTSFPVEMSFSLSKREDGYNVIAVMKDITERKRAEEELSKTKDHLDNIIESSLDSIIISDDKGKITRVNKAFLELLGYEKEEVIGKNTVELTPVEAGSYEATTGEPVEIGEVFLIGAKAMVEKLYEEGKISSWESYYLRKDNKVVPVEMSIVFLYNKEGGMTGAVGINRDITERKKAEKELRETTIQLVQSEKLSALGELTAGVAHELNQPLNGIKIISQSLLKDIEKGQFEEEELGQDLRDIVNQVDKMAEIIDHMRIFTRRSEGVPNEVIEVNSIVEGAFKFLGQQLRNHNIEVAEDLGSDLPKIVGDPIRLEQVFLNLISNARNAIEGGGKEKMRIDIRTYADNTNGGSSVVIEVKDNGSGVPEHIREKIFQPFFTTNAPGTGTGLGLSVSSKIIEEHQGRIELKSEMGEGTTFRMILPGVD
jgi:PAS domain S-box-containing protein